MVYSMVYSNKKHQQTPFLWQLECLFPNSRLNWLFHARYNSFINIYILGMYTLLFLFTETKIINNLLLLLSRKLVFWNCKQKTLCNWRAETGYDFVQTSANHRPYCAWISRHTTRPVYFLDPKPLLTRFSRMYLFYWSSTLNSML